MDSPETKEEPVEEEENVKKKGSLYIFFGNLFRIFFTIWATFSLSFLVLFLAVFVGNLSIWNPISVPSQCKIVSSSVDLRSSKVCELGLLNYRAKHVFYPNEKKKFRCHYDYYWASVFKVEYVDHSGQRRLAFAEAPNEALPSNCRPTFGAAWLTKDKFKMIERALQELNEKGGSSEESISMYITKEYDDLPWAHYTMLKHHLEHLCKSGEVVLTSDKRYSLAGGNLDLKVRRKCRRKSTKRKRGWDWEKKRSKQRRKVTQKETMVQKGDDVVLLFSQQKDLVISQEVNEEENCMIEGIKDQNLNGDDTELPLNQQKDRVTSKEVVKEEIHMAEGVEQQNLNGDGIELLVIQPKDQGTSNEIHEMEDWMIQGIEQQKLEAESSKDTEELCVAEGKGVDCYSDAPPTVAPTLLITDRKEDSEKSTVQQQSSDPTAGITDICIQNTELGQGGKYLEDNHTELSSPERPPGFESVILEEVSHVQPWTAVSSKLPIHQGQLNQHDEHDILDDAKASGPELGVIEESIPTDRMQRQMKRWSKRLSRDKASSISDVLPSPELQGECPPKSELSDQDRAHGKHHSSMESTVIEEVHGKQCCQWQNVPVDSSETLQQLDSETLSKLPCLDRHPAESKHHVEPSEHERNKQVAQGKIRSALRPRPLKPAITKANCSSPLDQQERQKLESQCPGTEITNFLIISRHQNKQDLFSERAECEPSKGATQEKLLPKHHRKKKQQIRLRCLGRPPKSRNLAKAEPDVLVVAHIRPSNHQNQQHNEHPTQPLAEKLDITTEDNSLSKSVHDPHLEQQLEKPRHGGCGRPPKHKRGASSLKKSNLQQHGTTKYQGRGRPRKADRKE